jgi:hypothetical protein
MSSNRLIYDTCESRQRINESAGPLDYMLSLDRYENKSKCRTQLGLVGGANVSHIAGDLVDLETDLFGITRKASLCPTKKYLNKCAVSNDQNNCQRDTIHIEGNPSTQERDIDTNMLHLPNCQMIRYKPVPLPEPINVHSCNGSCSK